MTLPDSEGTQRAVTASHLIRRFNQAIHAGDPVGGIFNTVRMADLQAAIVAAGADKEDQVCHPTTRACRSHQDVHVYMSDVVAENLAGMDCNGTCCVFHQCQPHITQLCQEIQPDRENQLV